MKKVKNQRKELTAKIISKVGEVLEGINDKAFRKVKRSTENRAKELAKKFTAVIEKLEKEEAKKAKKKDKKSAKESKTNPAHSKKAETKQAQPKDNVPPSQAKAPEDQQ